MAQAASLPEFREQKKSNSPSMTRSSVISRSKTLQRISCASRDGIESPLNHLQTACSDDRPVISIMSLTVQPLALIRRLMLAPVFSMLMEMSILCTGRRYIFSFSISGITPSLFIRSARITRTSHSHGIIVYNKTGSL